jgi:glycosyltransferase involved in cell wall biosynthesis
MADKNKNMIIWSGDCFDAGGYATNNREYIKGLVERGWDVKVEARVTPHEISEEEIEFFSKLGRGPFASGIIVDPVTLERNPKAKVPSPPDAIRILSWLPLARMPKPLNGKRIIYTMMECEKVKDDFIHERCNKYYEYCFCPTGYNKRVFEECGLSIPCKIQPLIINDIYKTENSFQLNLNYKVFGSNAPEQPSGFKFLSVFRWSYRKGFDVLIKSFLREFKKSDNVSLVIVSRHAAQSPDPKFKEAVEFGILSLYNEYATADSPPIYWCGDVVPTELMPSMYSIGDCFITCSRGEGLCMPVLEASKMGLPIIAPLHTGFTDYLTEENANAFPVDEWVVCNSVPEWSQWITKEFFGQRFPLFGEKTIEQVRHLMRNVKENPEAARVKNELLQSIIKDKYGKENCLDIIEKHLEEI